MPSNHLEDLIAEWYEFNGYFLRRNIQVGKRPKGGYECELDIVGFNPRKNHLVHIEPSVDAHDWGTREMRFSRKFQAGLKYIPELFAGLAIPQSIEQIAVLVFASKSKHETVGGGKVVLVKDLLSEIFLSLRGRRIASSAIPEHLPLLRTLQFAAEYWKVIHRTLSSVDVGQQKSPDSPPGLLTDPQVLTDPAEPGNLTNSVIVDGKLL